jgi:hypothetical protein
VSKRFSVDFLGKNYQMSGGEFYFWSEMKANLKPSRLPMPEYRFSYSKHRFDFAWLIGNPFSDTTLFKLAVEVEGGTFFGKSRHGSGFGYEGDCHKYNKAQLDGWVLLRFTTRMILKGYKPLKSQEGLIFPTKVVLDLLNSKQGNNELLNHSQTES